MPWAQIAPNYHRNTILLGNGASIAVSPVLDYGSLLAYAHRAGLLTHDMNRLFQFFRTSDFRDDSSASLAGIQRKQITSNTRQSHTSSLPECQKLFDSGRS
ncbi:DUF4917 family protein [Klebsiella pneumoniae]|uniref:DUF4917 family protein n=1 Tax=Klebsiella pneumoniae TaxID=573 RepID=UPI003D9AB754